jgi:hypothetical protein
MQTNTWKFWVSRIMTSSLGLIEYWALDLCYTCTLTHSLPKSTIVDLIIHA